MCAFFKIVVVVLVYIVYFKIEKVAAEIDAEIRSIIEDAFVKAEDILNEHMNELHLIAKYLMKYEKIDGDNFYKLMRGELTEADIDADDEKNLPEKCIVKGAIFDFRKSLLPIEFSATNPNAMRYFESLEATQKNPVFTCVWGRQVSETVVRQIVTESAFGEDEVREVKNTRRDFVITGAAKEPYVWDDPSTITADELTNAMTARQTYLATVKQRADEFKAQRASGNAGAPASGEFNF